MSAPAQFPYTHVAPAMGNAGWMPLLPITLRAGTAEVSDLALVDSGAAVSVLPYDLGVQLGLDWNAIPVTISLTGTLASSPAKPVVLDAVIAPFGPARLGFGWTQSPAGRLLLGQTNFFQQFDVFFRKQLLFQIQPATP